MPEAVALPGGRAVLLHGAAAPLSALAPELRAALDHAAPLTSLDDVDAALDAPAVLVLDAELAALTPDLARRLDALPPGVVVVAADDDVATAVGPHERVLLTLPRDAQAAVASLHVAFRYAVTRHGAARLQYELTRSREELRQLNRIGMALMTERDPNRLLVEILDQAMALTSSDAGSLYLVEIADDGSRRLRFKLSRNASLPDLPFADFTLPIDVQSIAGYAAHTGQTLAIDDAYEIAESAPYRFNRGFDERVGYRTRSMLVVPMKDHRDEVVGVLQLINRKTRPDVAITSEQAARDFVRAYTAHEHELVGSLAGQAAVSIENSQLHAEIQRLFESFVKAAVTAIDQRDPTTAGHSLRVATLTVDMADALQRNPPHPYREVRFTAEQMRELRYAGLLHDFGKVGVREEVLVKAKKLPPTLIERVDARFDLVRRSIEAEYHYRRAEFLREHGRAAFEEFADLWEAEFQNRIDEMERFHAAVRAANEPSILPEQAASVLQDVAGRTFRGPRGEERPLLEEAELHFLSIPKGTLDDRERLEIESHVEQTYQFLSQIPWTQDLRNVADIAYGHHEKLNGRGYPRRLTAEQIPVQTRMMTIADIFDALTARDRPYKKALPHERAFDILRMEAKDGLVDAPLVELMIESQVYRKVLELDWTEL